MDAETWFLHKISENEIYGPTTLDTLRTWSAAAKVSPMDKVSSDNQKTWLRAPMIPELQMDWLIELGDGRLYGPTNMGTIHEFILNGEITEDEEVINCLENKRIRITDLPFFQNTPRKAVRDDSTFAPPPVAGGGGTLADSIETRVRRLEERVRVLEEWLRTR